jgi:hypothetical protein
MNSARWLIICAGVALVCYFALRPTYILEEQVGSGWSPIESYSQWIWNPAPQSSTGGRFRADWQGAAIYSAFAIVIAASALMGIAFENRWERKRGVTG